ncbi:MAG: GNAT family N-acetyltransferase [Thermomicrobiales bacterium]
MTAPPVLRVEPLLAEDVRSLYIPWSSPFESMSLARHLRSYPTRAFWLPETGEYIVGEPWRHRDEITAVVDISARANGALLLDRLRQPASEPPQELIVMTDFAGARQPSFYTGHGLGLMQEVLCYELRAIPPEPPRGLLAFSAVSHERLDELAALIAVDHASFPWLWWNSAAEFAAYGQVPGVALYIGADDRGTAVSYVGLTHFRGWGHLDRIGVVPGYQGSGYGLESLRFAARMLARGGATRLGLSTQANNTRSQHLYHRFGFQRTYQNDYNIYGAWMNPARAATAWQPEGAERRSG